MNIIFKQLNKEKISLNKLYQSNRDGLTATKFHELCDNKGPTLIIIKSDIGYIFGGYTSVSWTSPKDFLGSILSKDPTAFLFQIHPELKVFKLKSKDDPKAVRSNTQFLFAFGKGCDLLIRGTQSQMGSFSMLGSYDMENPMDLIGGHSTLITVDNMETFQVLY
mmetsp:Transcript_79671/g.97483  ORF Transcript_79671/g.97483 Transcript_79671/m.97483 type:complete len:164 (+) Transcript_79671:3-494(+)